MCDVATWCVRSGCGGRMRTAVVCLNFKISERKKENIPGLETICVSSPRSRHCLPLPCCHCLASSSAPFMVVVVVVVVVADVADVA